MNQTQSVTAKIVEGTVWSSGSSLAVKIIGLITTVTVIRILSVPEYGLYQLTLAAYGILAAFFFAGFDQVVLTDLMRAKGSEDFARFKRLFSEFAVLKLMVGATLFLVSFLGANLAGAFYGENIAFLVRIIAFLFPIVALERILNVLLNINLSFRAMSLFTLIEEAVKLGLVFFFSFVVGFGVQGIVLSVVGASAVALLSFMPYGIRLYQPFAKSKALSGRNLISEAFLAYGKWAVGSKYLNDLQRNIRPWLIRLFLSTEAVGLYTIAENLYSQVVSLVPLGTVLTPIVSQTIHERKRINNLVYYGAKYGTILFLILSVFSAFAVPLLVGLLFPQHINSIPLFYVILLIMPPAGLAAVLTAVFYAQRQQKAHFFIMFLTLVITLIMGSILVNQFGIIGMAVEFTISAYFYNILRTWYLFRTNPDLRFSLPRLFKWDYEDVNFIKFITEKIFRFITVRKT